MSSVSGRAKARTVYSYRWHAFIHFIRKSCRLKRRKEEKDLPCVPVVTLCTRWTALAIAPSDAANLPNEGCGIFLRDPPPPPPPPPPAATRERAASAPPCAAAAPLRTPPHHDSIVRSLGDLDQFIHVRTVSEIDQLGALPHSPRRHVDVPL